MTRVLFRGDESVVVATTARGANLNVVGFNMDLILLRRPSLAVKILEVYREARQVKLDGPEPANEEYERAIDEFEAVMGKRPEPA